MNLILTAHFLKSNDSDWNTAEIFLSQMLMSVLMGHYTCVLNIVTTLWAAITVTAM